MPKRKPLQLDNNDWFRRWLYFPNSRCLHRVSKILWAKERYKGKSYNERLRGKGITVCGREGSLEIPGFVSRLVCPRCQACCRLAGVPQGNGAPYNVFTEKELKEA